MDGPERMQQIQEMDRQIGSLGGEIMRMHDIGTDISRIDVEMDFLATLLRRRSIIRQEMKREQKQRKVDLDALA